MCHFETLNNSPIAERPPYLMGGYSSYVLAFWPDSISNNELLHREILQPKGGEYINGIYFS